MSCSCACVPPDFRAAPCRPEPGVWQILNRRPPLPIGNTSAGRRPRRATREDTHIDGIQAVQARIAEIQQLGASLGAPVSAPGVAAAAGAGAATGSATGVDASSGTFAAALNTAQAGDKQKWANDFLTRLGMPVTSENVRAIVAWEKAEGTKAQFNPLATTRSMPGATNFNSVGVKNYATYADGIEANAAALTNGLYGNVLAALQRGNSAVAVAQAIAASRWGTGNGVLRVLQSGG